jgi:hypothetical protein
VLRAWRHFTAFDDNFDLSATASRRSWGFMGTF